MPDFVQGSPVLGVKHPENARSLAHTHIKVLSYMCLLDN